MNEAAPTPPATDARKVALARLEASRSRLREALLPAHTAGAHPNGQARLWRQVLKRWWRRQPLAAALRIGGTELRDAVLPIVRSHPLTVMAAAAALGATVVLSRRALWRLIAGQMRPWSGSVGSWMLQQLSSPAVQAAAFAWMAQQTRAPAQTGTPAAASDAPPRAVDTSCAVDASPIVDTMPTVDTAPAAATDDLR